MMIITRQDAMAVAASFINPLFHYRKLLLFQNLAVLLFGINTENRMLEELEPEAAAGEILEPRILDA